MKHQQVKMRSTTEKSEIRGISRISDLSALKSQNTAFGGVFKSPVYVFNLDSLPKAERKEITKIFWNKYVK